MAGRKQQNIPNAKKQIQKQSRAPRIVIGVERWLAIIPDGGSHRPHSKLQKILIFRNKEKGDIRSHKRLQSQKIKTRG